MPEHLIDFESPAFLTGDRMAAYARLRGEAPVWPITDSQGKPAWVLSRHADAHAVLRAPGSRVQALGEDAPPWLQDGPALDRLRGNISQTDGPLHQRLRGVLGSMFIPRKVEALREVSADSVRRALDALEVQGTVHDFDAVAHLAAQVPKGVICHLLGVPEEDWQMLVDMQHDFLLIFSPFPLGEAHRRRLDDVAAFYLDYFGRLLANDDVREHSALANLLLAAQERGELSRVEVLSIMHTVLDAGYETTRTSISNAMELMGSDAALFAGLHEVAASNDASRLANAVEELLRVRSPIHMKHRFLAEPYTASDGTVIPAGAQALMLLASANCDEAVFEDPDRIDLDRPNAARHLAFGGGLHHCLGAAIARIQLQESMRGITARYASLSLPGGLGARHASLKFPALASLRVSAVPRAPAGQGHAAGAMPTLAV